MGDFTIKKLVSGGLITNYNCTSKCQHCLYACSAERDKSYIEAEQCCNIFRKIKSLGCKSIHIGGGEPMMNVNGLIDVLKCAKQEGINIEYVETNSSWFKDEDQAESVLMNLRSAGLQMLLVSISPFHNEFIPFNKVKGVIKACAKSGITVFPWTQEFFYDIASLDGDSIHTNENFKLQYGDSYFLSVPYRYWIHYGGRALSYFSGILPMKLLADILTKEPCNELIDTSHFHVDLYGNYIPSLCIGQSIKYEELGNPLKSDSYSILNILLHNGITSLYDLATSSYGFKAQPMYLNKCHLCSDIRKHFVINHHMNSKELQPMEFYKHI